MAERVLRTDSASPLYAQMMERIRLDILRGVYPVGERIPPEHQLEERYGVSRVTVRRALQELTAAGLLERKQGKGTFVSQPRPQAEERGVMGFHEACRALGRKPSVGEVRFRETEDGEEDRIRLGLPPEAGMLRIQRVLKADGEPVILETVAFSAAYAWLEGVNLKGSLYRALQEYGIRAEKSIYDLSLTRLPAEEAAKLQAEEGTVVLSVEQVVYDQKGRPLHTGHLLVRGEKFPLRI